MRNRELHDALRDFALEAAALLSAAVQAGAELPYDVVEEPGTGAVLYRYQPLTAEFIGARWDSLHVVGSFEPAARALGAGAESYLRVRGLPGGADSEPALRAMLERLYEDATSFDFPEERFERVYAEVERILYEDTSRASVVAPVHGLVLVEQERLELGDGLVLARGDRVAAPPEAVWPLGPDERERAVGPNVVCALERDVETGDALPVTEARLRFRRVLTALRLLRPGRASLGGVAFGRAEGGVWRPVAIGFGGPSRGEPLTLTAADGEELAELVGLVTAARLPGRVAWALARFEMGCERASEAEALSDHLLALRSLLDADDDTGRASLGLRLAALCADEPHRRAVRRRLDAALALEARLMSGDVTALGAEDGEGDPPAAVVRELERHVRALLRDVVCGYLDGDLRAAADDILLASSDEIEIRARDTRGEAAVPPPATQTALDLADEMADAAEDERDPRLTRRPAPRQDDGPGTAADPRSAAWAVAALPGPRTRRRAGAAPADDRDLTLADRPLPGDAEPRSERQPEPASGARPEPEPVEPPRQPEPVGFAVDSGVTPSADWDDDPDSFSAPI
ncbi:MAG TPA: hypothetical protein VF520_16870 [Thermoleophilaceae bacterium]